jgi:hypothetical protein
MDNATKRPWIADPDDREGYEWNIHILQADDTNIRVCFMSNGPASEANAALIVTAVNQHAALLRCAEALKFYADSENWCDDTGKGSPANNDYGENARAALWALEQSNGG